MPPIPDPYRVLGVTRGASIDEVRRAYRRLAKANHPDAAGPSALPRFLAIHAAYEQVARSLGASTGAGPDASTPRRRPSSADADRTGATRRAYGGRARATRPDPDSGPGTGSGPAAASGPAASGPAAGSGRRSSSAGSGPAGRGGNASQNGGGENPDADPGQARRPRGKATLGSTSYDGADASPFEPDWGGASWYGTTSGTYWTINPKEYADPRKHGPEYQARARRSSRSPGAVGQAGPGGPLEGGDANATTGPDAVHAPRTGRPAHTTSSWWDSTAGPAEDTEPGPANGAGPAEGTDPAERAYHAARDHSRPPIDDADPERRWGTEPDGPAPDPARAAIDLGRALTDPRSGGVRGRVVRAVIGWLPIALGLGWTVGEVTGCGRFAATCDPSVGPLTAIGQGILLVVLLLLPELAAVAAGAALVLLAAATAASLILSATGAAADEASRRGALSALLAVAWLSGLAVAAVRRIRLGLRRTRPVS